MRLILRTSFMPNATLSGKLKLELTYLKSI